MLPKNPLEMLTPTVALAAGALAVAFLKRPEARYAGAALAAWGGWRAYQDQQLMVRPDLMNGYFKTGGMLSATRGPAQAGALDAVKKRVGS